MRKKNLILYVFFISFCISSVNAQSVENKKSIPNKISTLINEGVTFDEFELFTTESSKKVDEKINAIVDNYTLLSLNNDGLQRLKEEKPNSLEFTITDEQGKSYDLLLYKVDIFTPDFTLRTSDPTSDLIKSTAVHYRGVISKNENSLVAISFLEDEVMGIISNGNTQLILGKLEGNTNSHILYYENDMKISSNFECGTASGEGAVYAPEDLVFEQKMVNGNCVRVYVEVDNDIFLNKGSGTANYITGLFNQSATIYANDGISLVLSDMFIWETTHNYTGNCSFEVLESFQNATSSINGDIGHLVSYDSNLGGIAAGFNGLCNSNIDESLCFSGIHSSYSTVPTYSWSVMVFTHEMGHLLGSRHTHACVWNNNNTAIDGCGSCQEEPNPPPSSGCFGSGLDCNFCTRPPAPAGGGTIMSYCHINSVGINFNLGFGPQPSAVIQNNIANASCLSSCGESACYDESKLYPVTCDTDYEPICSCDNITYYNTCAAWFLNGITQYWNGPCTGAPDVDLGCPNINFANFDNYGWGVWNDGGAYCVLRTNSTYANSGSKSVELRRTGYFKSDDFDFSNYDEITLEFSLYARNMDNTNDRLWISYSNNGGAGWYQIDLLRYLTDFQNNTHTDFSITFDGYFSSTTSIRFKGLVGTYDYFYIDDIRIKGCHNESGNMPGNDEVTFNIAPEENIKESQAIENKIQVRYSTGESLVWFNREIPGDGSILDYQIFDLQGRMIKQSRTDQDRWSLDTQDLPKGMYILNSKLGPEKFIVN